MAVSADPAGRRYTYADLEAIPDDNVIRSLIDGELYVTPTPITRHQKVSGRLYRMLADYADSAAGEVYYSPYGVYFTDTNFVEPDLIFIRADHLDRNGPKYMRGAPDLVVEISSPSTKRLDRGRKRELYERFRVPEFWFVDLESETVEVSVLSEGRYGAADVRASGDIIEPAGLPGLSVSVAPLLAG